MPQVLILILFLTTPHREGLQRKCNMYFANAQGHKIKIICVYPYPSVVLKKIPGGVKTVGDLCFQLKKPLFHRNQRHAETTTVVGVTGVEVVSNR